MELKEKGLNLRVSISDYTVIDLETTGRNSQTCEIIELAAVRVRNSEIVDQFTSLVKPQKRIPSDVTNITGITNEMVQNAPSCSEILKEYLDFIGNDIVIGHNIRTFDCKILGRLAEELLHIPFVNNQIDTVYFARYCDISPENYKLTTLSAYFNIPHSNAHRALGDCIANQKVYEAMKPLLTDTFREASGQGSKQPRRQSASTKALLELSEYISFMTEDNYISDQEINVLETWLDDNKELAGNYPYDIIYEKVTDILKDRIITDSERNELLTLLIEQSDPIQHHAEECENIDFNGKTICLTGDFDSGSRSEIEKIFEKAGSIISKNVTLKTDYLIVGGSGSSAWSCGNYGNKVKKALELQEKGEPIKIIREDVAMSCICEKSIYDKLINEINQAIEWVSSEMKLPNGFLKLIENQKTHSVWIIEPVTQKKSQMILTVAPRGRANEKYARIEVKTAIINRSALSNFTAYENDSSLSYYDIRNPNETYATLFYDIINDCAIRFIPSEKFGCCEKYRECSAAKKCLHDNQIYAKACWYRKNIESGKIFY